MKKQRLIGITLAAALLTGTYIPAYAADTDTADQKTDTSTVQNALSDGTLQLSELDGCVRSGNPSVRACLVQLDSAKRNFDDREGTLKSLKEAERALTDAIEYAGASGLVLQSQQDTILDQIDEYNDVEKFTQTYNCAVLQLQSGVNQIVKASESLYYSIVQMDYSMRTIQHNLDALQRSLDIMQLQCKLGQASNEDLRALQDQYTNAKSQLASLEAQSKISKQNLQSMIGVTPDGSLRLTAPSAITDTEIASLKLPDDITAGKAASAELSQDQKAVDDAKDDWDDMPNSPVKKNAYEQAVYAKQAAESNFGVGATTLYQSLLEKQRLYKVAETDLASAQKTYTIADTKYKLGILSQQQQLTAKDALTAAQEKVEQTALDLSGAYTAYHWVALGLASAQ